jgi:predicted transcriptional regulator
MSSDKHRKKVEAFLANLAKKGYLQQIASRVSTREPVYIITEKGRRLGVQKQLKGIL